MKKSTSQLLPLWEEQGGKQGGNPAQKEAAKGLADVDDHVMTMMSVAGHSYYTRLFLKKVSDGLLFQISMVYDSSADEPPHLRLRMDRGASMADPS